MKKFLVVVLLMCASGGIGYYSGTGKLQVTDKSVSIK